MGNEYYYLFLVLDKNYKNEESVNFLSNKQLLMRCSLEEIDDFTVSYQDAKDLASDLDPDKNVGDVVNAIIISGRMYQRLKETSEIKIIPVLFFEDQDFLNKQMKGEMGKYNYDKNLIKKYRDYLLNHPSEIRDSLVRNVSLGIEIGASITTADMERVFFAYYNKRGYLQMRETYFELKKLGVIELPKPTHASKRLEKK